MVGLLVKVPLSSPPWLGMNCTWTVVKMPGRFATWPCIMILFYDPGLTFIYQNSDLFGSINFLGALGDLRIKFQLRHGQLEQMQEQKTRRDGVASPWLTSVKSLKMYGNLMVKSKRKQGIMSDSTKQKLPRGPFPREVMGLKWIDWIWLTSSSHVRPYPPTSDEIPVTLSPQSVNHLTVEASWRILTCA